jgi:carbon storage regulator
MLILSRKVGESISIGDNITVVVNRIAGNRVAIGIQAPSNIRVIRGELERFTDEFEVESSGSSTESTPVPSGIALEHGASTGFVPRSAR